MRYLPTLFLLFHTLMLDAQWSNNPANPGLVTEVTGQQKNIQILSDSLGGVFAFWRDNRTLSTQYEIYGQHYNSEGVPQWETNGRLLISEATSVELFQAISLLAGQFSLIWQFNAASGNPSNEGKIKCQRFNINGQNVWPASVVLAEMANSGPVSLFVVRDFYAWTFRNRIYFGWFGETFGVNVHRFSRVDLDGNPLSPIGGYTVSPFLYAGAEIIPDGFGGVYFHSFSSNSSFFGIGAQRYDSLGAMQWTQGNLELVPATSMTSIHAASSDTGGIIAFHTGQNDLQARRLKRNGDPDWNGASRMICNAEGVQLDPQVIRKENGEYIVIWADSRPGAVGQFAVYGQKLDAEMTPLWGVNGVLLSNQTTGSYIDMNLRLISDASGIYTAVYKAGSSVWATRFDENGNLLNTPGDLEVLISPVPAPINSDFDAIMLEEHSIAVWSDGQDARAVCFYGCSQTLISNQISVCESYVFNGITYNESGIYTIELPGDTLLELDLTVQNFQANISLSDFTLNAPENYESYRWISCTTNQEVANGSFTFTPNENGEYALVASLNGCSDTTDCISVTGVGITNVSTNPIRLFPNPASSVLNLDLPNAYGASILLEIYDSSGRRLLKEAQETKKTHQVSVDTFPPGMYAIRVIGQNITHTLHWIKL